LGATTVAVDLLARGEGCEAKDRGELRSTALDPEAAGTTSTLESSLSAACRRPRSPFSAVPSRGDKQMTPMAIRNALWRHRRGVRWREFACAESS